MRPPLACVWRISSWFRAWPWKFRLVGCRLAVRPWTAGCLPGGLPGALRGALIGVSLGLGVFSLGSQPLWRAEPAAAAGPESWRTTSPGPLLGANGPDNGEENPSPGESPGEFEDEFEGDDEDFFLDEDDEAALDIETPDARIDYIEPVNRAVFAFNDKAQTYVLIPVGQAYVRYTPSLLQKGLKNFFTNLKRPLTVANAVLQADADNASRAFTAFWVDSTFGLLGVLDISGATGLTYHREDFGQTLGVWGVGEIAYLELPILGPSSVRDVFGSFVADDWLEKEIWGDTYRFAYFSLAPALERGLSFLGTRGEFIQNQKATSLDPYASFRSFWYQNRQKEIANRGGEGEASEPSEPSEEPSPASEEAASSSRGPAPESVPEAAEPLPEDPEA